MKTLRRLGTIVLAWTKPIEVPAGLTNDDYERIRQDIEDNMLEASQQAEDRVREIKEKRKRFLWRTA